MKQKKQNYFPGFEKLGIVEFGGSYLRGNPREARPISTKRAIHLVMRSSLAKGERSFLRPPYSKQIKELVYKTGKYQGVKIYQFANSGNHLHLLILPKSHRAYCAFIRAITGLIARMVLNAERGKAFGKKFWDARPFTRIVEWGMAFRMTSQYLLQNTLEALGFIPYQPRKHKSRLVVACA